MRDIAVLVVFIGLIYFAVRQVGCTAPKETSPNDVAATATAKTDEGAESSDEQPTSDATKNVRSRTWRDTLERATREIASSGMLLDPNPIREIAVQPGTDTDWARGLLDSADPNSKTRWLGLSRVAANSTVDEATHEALVRLASEVAPAALRLPEASVTYRVVRGDALAKICAKLKKEHAIDVTPGLLRWTNGLRNDLIYPDQELHAPIAPFRIWVSRSRFRLRALVGDGLIAEFPVGIGKDDRTPTGTFTIRAPMKKAPWRNPETGEILHFGDAGYAIGTRWLGFEPNGPHVGLGIHGTDEPDSIGTAASLGCVRMRNTDVELLFEWVPEGTQVTIVE